MPVSDLLREIDKDVAKEKSEQFLEKWGLPIGVFLVILIGGLFFYFNWQSRSEASALSEANNFAQSAEFLVNDPEGASALLTDLSLSNSGFAELAEFKVGDSLWASGEYEAAIEAWQAYVQNPEANQELINTTRFKLAWFGNAYLEPNEVLSHIDTLETQPVYESYASVLRALHAASQGNVDEAKQILEEASASDTPSLARDLADAVGVLVNSL